MSSLVRRPDAWLPLSISIAAMALVLGYALVIGPAANPAPHDEGAPARLFQLLLALDALAIAVFAGRRLPQTPREAAAILALQLAAAALPVVTLLVLEA